jgi:hypothetical protein
MSLRIHLCGREVRSFDELLRGLPANALASPRRSTVPLLDYWRPSRRRLDNLWPAIGHPPSDPVELHFEYGVPVRSGRGKPSYTDLMVLADDVAVAIEAKFTEPPYESVDAWLGRAATPNRIAVLDGWLSAVGESVGRRIARGAVGAVPYQLIHRTASVCCVDRPHRHLVYQVFSDEMPQYYVEQLRLWVDILGENNGVGLAVYWCRLRRSEAYRSLEARWDAGGRDFSQEVRRELLEGPLLDFFDAVVTPIRASV